MRVATGIPELDSHLNGGLVPASINLLRGPPGAGKTTLSLQYLLEDIKAGKPAAYISLEERREHFIRNMSSFAFPTSDLISKNLLHFEHMSADELGHRLSVGAHDIGNLIADNGIARLVIDSVSAFLLMWDGQHLRQAQTKRLFELLRQWGVTCLVTCHDGADDGYGIDYLADSVIRLGRTDEGRILHIEKMRGSAHAEDSIPYGINDSGLYTK